MVYYLYSEVARKILGAIAQGKSSVSVSLDLNKSTEQIEISNKVAVLDEKTRLDERTLERIADEEKRVFKLINGDLRKIEYADGHYYKLVPTDMSSTLEIDGVQMHRTKDYDPFADARDKVAEVVQKDDEVLDTCGGLGYTAIWAVRMGAARVVSVESNEIVSAIRKENPWSDELQNSNIELVQADISEHIKSVAEKTFDSIIHDPPRFSLAGELYGREFYSELYRVLRRGGRVFHYTGYPYTKHRKKRFVQGIVRRLKEVGFETFPKPEKLGVKAIRA